MPVEMPDGCSDESWTKLSVVNTELPPCSNGDAPLGSSAGSLPPAYLQVPDFESCLGSETSNDGSSEMWCMPVEMPDGCSDESWTKLSVVNTELPLCSNGDAPLGSSAGSLPPAYLQMPDFESCLGTKD